MSQDIKVMLILSLFPLALSAIPADDAEPIDIQADHFLYDNAKGRAIYSGHVVVHQGSREFSGETLELIRDDQGHIAQIIMRGKPAQHHALSDIHKPPLFAKANTIAYDTQGKLLTLVENAWIEQAGDEYAAPRIEYNVTLQTVQSSLNALGNNQGNESGRTSISLKPRDRTK